MDHIGYLHCIVPAAGLGARFGAGGAQAPGQAPKQFLPIAGRSLLGHSLARLSAALTGAGLLGRSRLLVALPEGFELPQDCILEDWPATAYVGADTRQRSVCRGLDYIADHPVSVEGCAEWVLIHDGDRPCLPGDDLARLLELAADWDGATLCYPLNDSLIEVEPGPSANGAHECTPNERERHRLVATPQLFRLEAIDESHRRAASQGWSASDDAGLASRAGYRVGALDSSGENLKLTHPFEQAGIASLLSAADSKDSAGQAPSAALPPEPGALAPAGSLRIGHGYDLHRLVDDPAPDAGIWLAGVKLACPLAVEAHSDGDVLIHALIDAIFGALALGDLGRHFPDKDSRHRDRSGLDMLDETLRRNLDGRWRIINADLTVLAERPRLAAWQPSLRESLAKGLGVDAGLVSIKATTTEGQDSIGAGRAIACHAVVLLSSLARQ